MKVTVTIETDNAAFDDNPAETSRILRKLSAALLDCPPVPGAGWPLFDVNGNRVGAYKVEEV